MLKVTVNNNMITEIKIINNDRKLLFDNKKVIVFSGDNGKHCDEFITELSKCLPFGYIYDSTLGKLEIINKFEVLIHKYNTHIYELSLKMLSIYMDNYSNKDMCFDKMNTIYENKKLFSDSVTIFDKKISSTSNNMFDVVDSNDKILNVNDLSYGEITYFSIMLMAFTAMKDSILLLNMPEIGLHCNIQENLIDTILKISKIKQLIIFTHSPSIIINGWTDHVYELSDIFSIKPSDKRCLVNGYLVEGNRITKV